MPDRNFLNTSHQSLKWFSQLNDLGQLDLRPSFQRRPVWTTTQKSFLIDSILRGYPVPEIYVYTEEDSDGNDKYSVVDGQQRLRACLEFMSDKFALNFDVDKLKPLYTLADTPWFGKRFSELPEDAHRTAIRQYKLIVRDLENVSNEEIRHLFHRLNQSNVVLNAQELRFSMYEGGLLATVEDLAKRPEWNRVGLFTVNQRRRMLDSEFISELVIGYLHWPQNKKDNLDHYYGQYSASFPFDLDLRSRFEEILTFLSEVFPKQRMNGTRWYRKSDFYTLFLAFARNRLNPDTKSADQWRRELLSFSVLVSAGIDEEDLDSPVSVYHAAVSRAASDRARRVRREAALIAYLDGQSEVATELATSQDADDDVEDDDIVDDDELDEDDEDEEQDS